MNKLTNIQQINHDIMFGNFTDLQLNSIIEAVKFARQQLIRENKNTMRVGTEVQFHSTKRGVTMQGRVTHIAQKYATVATDKGNWKVPMNMLKTLDKELA